MSAQGPGFVVESSTPVYAISIAAQLAGLHPQTLRQSVAALLLGVLLLGAASAWSTRWMLSARVHDYAILNLAGQLREIAGLSAEGLSLEGIRRVIELRREVEQLRSRLAEAHREQASTALVVWRPKKHR